LSSESLGFFGVSVGVFSFSFGTLSSLTIGFFGSFSIGFGGVFGSFFGGVPHFPSVVLPEKSPFGQLSVYQPHPQPPQPLGLPTIISSFDTPFAQGHSSEIRSTVVLLIDHTGPVAIVLNLRVSPEPEVI
jgi:hypothetical protein